MMLSNNFRQARREIIEESEKKLSTIRNLCNLKSFQGLDKAKVVSVTGSRSRSLSRQREDRGFGYNRQTFTPGEVPAVGDSNVLFSTGRSRWDDSKRLQLCANSGTSSITPSNSSLVETLSAKVDFKTLVTIFMKRSSIYALNQVGNSPTTRRKIFWAFIMIVGLLGSITQIIQYLVAYFAYPVVVNIDSVSNVKQEFPAVTICNINSVRNEFLPCLEKRQNHNDCNISEDYDTKLEVSFINDLDDQECEVFLNASDAVIEQFLWKNLFSLQDNVSQILYGHQKTDFIRSCSFNGEVCGPDDFTSSVNLDYGNCFTFNAANDSSPPLTTPYIGPNGGLELELDLEIKKYTHFTSAVGARVEVHDSYHSSDVTQNGVNVSPGFETSITLSKYKMIRLPKPYKDNCEEYAIGDSVEMCIASCYIKIIFKQCSCIAETDLPGVRRCDYSKLSDLCCIFRAVQEMCDCPIPCDDTGYLINIFNAVWPSDPYNNANPVNDTELDKTLTTEEVRKTRLKVKIYYDTLVTKVYQQKPMYQNSELFSQIGGQMGLWLGLSLVALFECIENFVLIWQYRARQTLQNNINER